MKLLILLGLIAVAAAYPPIRGEVANHPPLDETKCVFAEYDLGYRKVEFRACQTPCELAILTPAWQRLLITC